MTFPGWVGGGGLVKSKFKLNSAKVEAQASSLSLAELGNTGMFSGTLYCMLAVASQAKPVR